MEWDEEEASPRAQEKVRAIFRRVLSRREKRPAAVAKAKAEAAEAAAAKTTATAKAKAVQKMDQNATSGSGHGLVVQPKEAHKQGSIRHARSGIPERRKLEVSLSLYSTQHDLLIYP